MGLCFGAPVKASLSHSDTRPSNSTGTYDSTSTFKSTSSDSTWKSSSMEIINELPSEGQILPDPKLKVFTYADLKSCTRNFRTDTIIGEGGFGRVYRGWVDQKTLAPTKIGVGIMVAVKKLNQESMQGFEEWQSEVNFLGRLSHNNLVKLLGYCWEERELLLVYEFMPKGNLESHLFRRGSNHHPLSWDLRIRTAIGAARGLVFLHSLQIIYRDFKASNILLDSKYNAKLSDFGLAKNGPDEKSHITTRIVGTEGYAAPEYVSTGHLYVKSDVYAFGVVLLEMLTGLRAVDSNRPVGQINLIDWAKPFLSVRKKVHHLMDPSLDEKYPPAAAWKAAQLTLNCIASHHNSRPSMAEVLQSLEEIEKIQSPAVNHRNSKIGTRDSRKTPLRNGYSATESRYAHRISTPKGSGQVYASVVTKFRVQV